MFQEELKLICLKGRWVYVAMPGETATAFTETTESRHDSMVFVNEEHDFPQRLIYWFRSSDSLQIRVEGINAGEERSEQFNMVRKSG